MLWANGRLHGPEASGPLTSPCSQSPGSCSSWSLGPSWTPALAGDSAWALHGHNSQEGNSPGSNKATSNTAESYSRPKMGVARFSTRETVEGKPATMHTIPSKKVEWGATARMGASPLLTWVPFTTTRKPMQKKYALPKAAITLRHMNLQSGVAIIRQKEMFFTHYLKLETYSIVVTGCHKEGEHPVTCGFSTAKQRALKNSVNNLRIRILFFCYTHTRWVTFKYEAAMSLLFRHIYYHTSSLQKLHHWCGAF